MPCAVIYCTALTSSTGIMSARSGGSGGSPSTTGCKTHPGFWDTLRFVFPVLQDVELRQNGPTNFFTSAGHDGPQTFPVQQHGDASVEPWRCNFSWKPDFEHLPKKKTWVKTEKQMIRGTFHCDNTKGCFGYVTVRCLFTMMFCCLLCTPPICTVIRL